MIQNRVLIWGVTLTLGFFLIGSSPQAVASKLEKSVGAGMGFYSGSEATGLTPALTPMIDFSGNMIFKSPINLTHHFNVAYLMGTTNKFAGSYGGYNGYAATYAPNVRLNLAKETVLPYFTAGPLLGIYAVTLSSATGTMSQNQAALKYGYNAGIGVDWLKNAVRGEGSGWGIEFNYFYLFNSPGPLEFSAGHLTARGVRIELRYVMGDSK